MEPHPPSPLSLYGRDGRRKYLTPGERDCFIAAALSHPRADVGTLCLLVAYTGCRISEALALTPASFDVAERYVVFRSLKKRGQIVYREVPLPDHVVAAIERIHRLADAHPDRLWKWSRGQAWSLIKRTMMNAGIPAGPWATSKGLRHGFGVHAIGSRVPITMVQRWLGHSRLSTTAIYTEALGPEEREIAALMW